jgi:hypothetical protein
MGAVEGKVIPAAYSVFFFITSSENSEHCNYIPVGICPSVQWLKLWLDNREIWFPFWPGARDFPLVHITQTGTGAH